MKKPSINLSKESIVDFFLNHGEKLVVGLFGALACTLVWGGIDAVRTKQPKRDQLPPVIVEMAGRTMKHIGDSKGPPAETTKRPSLAKQVEPWRENVVTAPAAPRIFNTPLSDEKAKRSAPIVLPLVDLQVRPGWAVIAVAQDPNQGMMMGMPDMTKENDDGKDKNKKKQKKGDPGDVAGGIISGGGTKGKNKFMGPMGPMGPGGPMMGGGEAGSMMPLAPPVMPGKIIPYCLVTALVPANAQQEAFMRAFASSGLQTQADIPLWSDYRIERAEVPPGTSAAAELNWKRLDLKAVAKSAEDWNGVQPEIAPPDLQLDPSQIVPMDETAEEVVPYVFPLPRLAGDPWGTESLHPWVVEQLRKRQIEQEKWEALALEEQEKASKTNILGGPGAGSAGPMGPGGGMGSAMGRSMMPPGGAGRSMMPPGIGSRGMMPPGGPMGGGDSDGSPMGGGGSRGMRTPPSGMSSRMMGGPGGMMPPGGMPPGMGPGGPMGSMMGGADGGMGMGMGMEMQLPEYRMFRFVDTTVEPGKSYRYRVQISVRNPNYGLPAQYLAEADLGDKPILAAEKSKPSPLAHVPDKTGLLVRALRKGETRKSKTGYEVLVLAENAETGNYWLKSLTTELGAFANLDKKLAKGPEAKTAETVTTNSILLDARGRQEDGETKKGAATGPSEPLELLFLREDGSFSVASVADSQRDYERYAQTLPAADDGKKGKDKDGEGGGSSLFPGGGAGGGLFGAPPGGGAGTPPGGPPGGARGSMPPGMRGNTPQSGRPAGAQPPGG